MRKLLLTALLAASVSSLFAQKLDDVQEKISKNKYDEAKEKIDKILADPKNQTNANAWYYKGKVYAELARQDTAGKLTYDAGKEAFDAFKKYQEMDKKNIMMTLDQNVGLFQLYDLYYNQGIHSYTQKDYGTAFDRMKRAMDLEEYIAARNYVYNGFSFPALDTQLVNLTASSAYLAKRQDESIPYFERLADARLKDKEYREVYGLLADYYMKKGDQAKADKYLNSGRELFPDKEYWVNLEFGDPGKDTLKRFAKYEEILQKHPDSYDMALSYAVDAFTYTYSYGVKPADYDARQARTQKALEKLLAIDPNSAMSNYIMSKHISNQIYDLEEARRAIKGTTPADNAKRKDLNTKIDQRYEDMNTYAQKTYDLYTTMQTKLTTSEKQNLRSAAESLADYYEHKKNDAKRQFYQDKMKTLF